MRKVYAALVVLLLGLRPTDARNSWLPPLTSFHPPPNCALPLGVSAMTWSAVKPAGKLTVERFVPSKPEIALRR